MSNEPNVTKNAKLDLINSATDLNDLCNILNNKDYFHPADKNFIKDFLPNFGGSELEYSQDPNSEDVVSFDKENLLIWEKYKFPYIISRNNFEYAFIYDPDEAKLKIDNAKNLLELCEILNKIDEKISFFTDRYDLPTFGEKEPKYTDEIYSWDNDNLLIYENEEYYIVSRNKFFDEDDNENEDDI